MTCLVRNAWFRMCSKVSCYVSRVRGCSLPTTNQPQTTNQLTANKPPTYRPPTNHQPTNQQTIFLFFSSMVCHIVTVWETLPACAGRCFVHCNPASLRQPLPCALMLCQLVPAAAYALMPSAVPCSHQPAASQSTAHSGCAAQDSICSSSANSAC